MIRVHLAAAALLLAVAAPSHARFDLGNVGLPDDDPCVLDPASCVFDPCKLGYPTVVACEPWPEPDPNAPPSFSHALSGNARTRGDGFKSSESYALNLSFDIVQLTFLAMDGDGTLYSGRLAPKGTKGDKFSLYLDAASAEAFATDVAARGAAASSRNPGAALGDHSKWTLELGGDSIELKIKSEVLVEGIGEVVYKAKLK
jgi:hypothetical protein